MASHWKIKMFLYDIHDLHDIIAISGLIFVLFCCFIMLNSLYTKRIQHYFLDKKIKNDFENNYFLFLKNRETFYQSFMTVVHSDSLFEKFMLKVNPRTRDSYDDRTSVEIVYNKDNINDEGTTLKKELYKEELSIKITFYEKFNYSYYLILDNFKVCFPQSVMKFSYLYICITSIL